VRAAIIGVVRSRTAQAAAIPLLALAFGLGACGSEEKSGPGNPASAATDYERALADAPPPLAALYAQANEILDGGVDAYESRIEELRGRPIVVNKWASWCGPCRAEFPFFQRQAAKHGEKIAFLGVDSEDAEDAAATFLEELPVPYPSYFDPEGEIAEAIDADREFPATVFYGSDGEIAYVHRGGYQDEADLVADIERYAR
jgi:cytochrome c biogenesis protein CcmG, thiol:disulfide interchange protein DsbE